MILFINSVQNIDNNSKFDSIYDKYYAYAYKIAYNILGSPAMIEDVLQDVYVNVWRTIDVITDEQTAKAWISTIARNTAINALNKNNIKNNKFIEIDDDVLFSVTSSEGNDPADIVVSEENVQFIYDAIKNLKHIYSDVLILKYKFHHSPEQIAKLLNLNIKTVYTRLERGTGILKEKLLSKERGAKK